jgi:hypothetical protein
MFEFYPKSNLKNTENFKQKRDKVSYALKGNPFNDFVEDR